MGHLGVGDGGSALDARPEAITGALIEGPIADHVVRHAGIDGQSRLLDGGAGRSAAVVDPAEEGQVTDPQRTGDVDVRVGLRRVGHHAPDLVRGDPSICDGRLDRLGGEPQFRAAGGLRELSGADADNGHLSRKAVRAHQEASLGSDTRTVPTTWSPIEFEPASLTVTTPRVGSAGSSAVSITSPRRVMVSSG